jgi:hypothetical protein
VQPCRPDFWPLKHLRTFAQAAGTARTPRPPPSYPVLSLWVTLHHLLWEASLMPRLSQVPPGPCRAASHPGVGAGRTHRPILALPVMWQSRAQGAGGPGSNPRSVHFESVQLPCVTCLSPPFLLASSFLCSSHTDFVLFFCVCVCNAGA